MITSRWLRKSKEYEKNAKENDEEDEEESLDLKRLSFNFSQTPSDINSIFIIQKPRKHQVEKSSKILFTVSCDSIVCIGETCDLSNNPDTGSRPAKCEQEENQSNSSDVATTHHI